MVASRSPAVAWLWLGAIVLGILEKLLREVELGQTSIDSTLSAWSGAVQSFMLTPTARAGVKEGYIQRADECKLLFLRGPDTIRNFLFVGGSHSVQVRFRMPI